MWDFFFTIIPSNIAIVINENELEFRYIFIVTKISKLSTPLSLEFKIKPLLRLNTSHPRDFIKLVSIFSSTHNTLIILVDNKLPKSCD